MKLLTRKQTRRLISDLIVAREKFEAKLKAAESNGETLYADYIRGKIKSLGESIATYQAEV